MLPDLERAERIGEFWSYPQSRTFAELLIDFEEDRTLRAMLVGMLREAGRCDVEAAEKFIGLPRVRCLDDGRRSSSRVCG
jgi:hypothetical protein